MSDIWNDRNDQNEYSDGRPMSDGGSNGGLGTGWDDTGSGFESFHSGFGGGAGGYAYGHAATAETLSSYTAKTYLWMFLGLLVTFGIAVAGYITGTITWVFSIPYGILAVSGLELLVVIVLSARLNSLSVGAAQAMFLFYAALNGVVFSAYFLLFGVAEMILVFAVTAFLFGLMAVSAKVFHIDVSGLRPLMVGGLVMLILFGILSLFVNLGAFETLLCYAGILIFLLFVAYDTRKIGDYYRHYSATAPDMLAKASIFSALQLYLDFINLFLYIIRLLNTRRR